MPFPLGKIPYPACTMPISIVHGAIGRCEDAISIMQDGISTREGPFPASTMPISIVQGAIGSCEDATSIMEDGISTGESPISSMHDAHWQRARSHFHL